MTDKKIKNEMKVVSAKEAKEIKKQTKKDETIFLAEINGKKLPTFHDYMEVVGNLFQFPEWSTRIADVIASHDDWITDLDWLHKDGYVLIIYNYKDLLKKDLKWREIVLEDFEESILPFWQEEIVNCVVEGKPKPFNVYLVE